jgi:hypothetical protein
LEGSKGGIYEVVLFLDGLTPTELTTSNGDGTESGQGTNDVEATTVFCLPLITEWFNDWCVGEVMANKGFGTGIDSLSATFVFAVIFGGFTFRLRGAFFFVFVGFPENAILLVLKLDIDALPFGLLSCGAVDFKLGRIAGDELGCFDIVPGGEIPLAVTPMCCCCCGIVLCVGAGTGRCCGGSCFICIGVGGGRCIGGKDMEAAPLPWTCCNSFNGSFGSASALEAKGAAAGDSSPGRLLFLSA